MIDVGISMTINPDTPAGGPAMSLLIENDRFYAVTPDEKKELPVKQKVSECDVFQRYHLSNLNVQRDYYKAMEVIMLRAASNANSP